MVRRAVIHEKLQKKKNEQKNQNKSNITCKNVVREHVFQGGANLAEIFSNLF